MEQRRMFLVLLMAVVLLPLVTAAAEAGTLGCGGSNILLSGGTEGNQVYTIYQFINYNDTGTISIDRMVVYTEDGTALCDLPAVQPFPAMLDTVLGPHASTAVTTLVMPCLPAPGYPDGSLSVVVYWSYTIRGEGMPLAGTAIEQVRDIATNQHQGRSAETCRELRLK